MAQAKVKKVPTSKQQAKVETTEVKPSKELVEDIDEILDEIDAVLEENAQDFVRAYVQKGGQ